MRELFKLNVIKDERGLLKLIKADIKGLQAEARAKYSTDGLRTLKANIDECTTAMMQLNAISMRNRIVTYYDVLEALKCFDIPEFEGVVLTEDFMLELHEEVNIRCNCFSSLKIPNVDSKFVETYKKEVTPERKVEIQAALLGMKTKEEKIEYLINMKYNYLQNIEPETLEVSGSMISKGLTGAQFLDRYIDLQIERILALDIKNKFNFSSIFVSDNAFILFNELMATKRIDKVNIGKRELYKIGAIIDILIENKYVKVSYYAKDIMTLIISEYDFPFKSNEWKKDGKNYQIFYQELKADITPL